MKIKCLPGRRCPREPPQQQRFIRNPHFPLPRLSAQNLEGWAQPRILPQALSPVVYLIEAACLSATNAGQSLRNRNGG